MGMQAAVSKTTVFSVLSITGKISRNTVFPVEARQDPSIENRQTVPEFGFAEFFSFCTRLLVKQEFPAAKALVGMTGFGT